MELTASSIAAITLYLLAAGLQAQQITAHRSNFAKPIAIVGLIAVVCHSFSLQATLLTADGLNLGFYKVSSLIFWVICAVTLTAMIRRPLINLLVVVFPLAALAIIVSSYASGSPTTLADFDKGLLVHILLSVSAYAVLTIAAMQAALVAIQDLQLKHHHTRGIIQVLPPLQLMETMLFEIIWCGVLLLTASILSGMIFLEDIFAQSLVHKTVLSIAAWLMFAVLLWGHHQLGWRSKTAVRWTLSGFVILMLGYFGSKLVLELILDKL